MRYQTGLSVVAVVFGVAVGVAAGEPAPPATTEERVAVLEKQVQTLMQAMLEKDNRIAELQRRIEELGQQQPGTQFPGLQFRGTQREMEQMLRNFQRDFFRDDPAPDDEFRIPWQREDPMPRGPVLRAPAPSKPRMGVSLEDPTPVLAERFGNEVKTGAFVMQVVPGTPAHRGGLMMGDCITAFDRRPVIDSKDLIEMVRKAEAGKHDVTLKRRGEELVLSIQLDALDADGGAEARPRIQDGWLRRGAPATAREVLVVRASALEMTPQLVKSLNLSAAQRGTMEEVLAKHAKQLSEEYTAKGGAGRGLVMDDADLTPLIEEHVLAAEKELAGLLSELQIQAWREHRRLNNRISVSRSLEQELRKEPDGMNF